MDQKTKTATHPTKVRGSNGIGVQWIWSTHTSIPHHHNRPALQKDVICLLNKESAWTQDQAFGVFQSSLFLLLLLLFMLHFTTVSMTTIHYISSSSSLSPRRYMFARGWCLCLRSTRLVCVTIRWRKRISLYPTPNFFWISSLSIMHGHRLVSISFFFLQHQPYAGSTLQLLLADHYHSHTHFFM